MQLVHQKKNWQQLCQLPYSTYAAEKRPIIEEIMKTLGEEFDNGKVLTADLKKRRNALMLQMGLEQPAVMKRPASSAAASVSKKPSVSPAALLTDSQDAPADIDGKPLEADGLQEVADGTVVEAADDEVPSSDFGEAEVSMGEHMLAGLHRLLTHEP